MIPLILKPSPMERTHCLGYGPHDFKVHFLLVPVPFKLFTGGA